MHKHHAHHSLQPEYQTAELTKLYWSQAVTTLASGLVAIFVLIFLLTLGYGLPRVLLYMMSYGLCCIPALYLSMRLVVKIGANRTMAIANVCQAIFMVFLITLPTHHWPLFYLSALAAWVNSTYWAPFHANFSAVRTPRKTGRQISYFYVVIAVAGGLAPAAGGILASLFHITLVYGIAAGLFLIAALSMFSGTEVVKPASFDLRRLKTINLKPDLLAYSGWAVIETIEVELWPILIFLIVTSYATIGLLSSALLITGILTTLYIGRREEATGEKQYITAGSRAVSLTNLGRIFVSGGSTIFGMNLLSGVSFHVLNVSFFTRFYKHVGRGPTLEYLFAMETVYAATLAGFYAILYVLSLNFSAQAVLSVGLLLTIPAGYLATRMG